ncbi:MAG: DUF5103 domain-containing protein [Bacteroidota bacterium]
MRFNFGSGLIVGAVLLLTGCPPSEVGSRISQTRGPDKTLRYEDFVYEPHIRTVQFYRGENPLSYPFLYLDEPIQLTLEFDALVPPDTPADNFWISIVNCDHEWRPTTLLPLEFLEGINTDRLYEYVRSENCLVPYIHYEYRFPAEGAFFKRSGNYLLKVYRAGNENDLILTRRLIVAQPKIEVEPLMGQAMLASDRRRIQRVDFKIKLTANMPAMFDPNQDLKVMILQNFRWDNAATELQPLFATGNTLEYQFDAGSEFAGGNEYRWLDIRTVRFYPDKIRKIEEVDSVFRVDLYTEKPRAGNPVSSRPDLNGGYFIDVQEYQNAEFESDYVWVRFGLAYPKPIPDASVYVYGQFCGWRCTEENVMTYNAAKSRYEGELLLKQGVYNYAYAVRKEDRRLAEESTMEGTHFETENYYTILVYFAPMGTRSPELLGVSHINYVY